MNAAVEDIGRYEQGTSLWQDAWVCLRRNRLAVAGGITLILMSLACVVAPWFISYGYE